MDIETSIMYKYNLKSYRVQHYQCHYQQTLGVKMASVQLTWPDSQSQVRHGLRQLFFIYGFGCIVRKSRSSSNFAVISPTPKCGGLQSHYA